MIEFALPGAETNSNRRNRFLATIVDMIDLPISEALPALKAQLEARSIVVLQAPPGAGKTTRVPPALLDASWLAGRRIVLLEPRRLAARAAAMRMAAERDEAVGTTVGYRIRFESKISSRTRIEVVTEGILTRQLQSDPALEGVGLVIFDEFHERHLQTDLGLVLALDAQRLLRPDLKVLIMSATLDGAGVARQLDAGLVTSSGRTFPVDVRYEPSEPDAPLAERAARAARAALATQSGDVLVFLPGAGEIRRAQALLADAGGSGVDILPLYGDLPWEQQDRALRPSAGAGRRKVVLATPIAETSLTIEGIRTVIDTGFARVPQFDPATGLSRLATVRVARASADQRAGRAGRQAPGVCYRLWTESTQHGLLAQPLPEIKIADLAGVALELALWGAKDETTLRWPDPPPRAALAQARGLLRDLGALDAEGSITTLGQAMARLPLHPRLAHLIASAAEFGQVALACDIASLLSERDVFSATTRYTVDLNERLEVLAAFRRNRNGARRHGVDPGACARIVQASRQWQRLVHSKDPTPRASRDVGALLALAYPDRVAGQRTANGSRYVLANGRGVRLPDYETHARPPYLVAAHVDAGGGEGMIHLAAPISAEAIRETLKARIVTRDVVRWDERTASVVARREEVLGKLALTTQSAPEANADEIGAAMLEGVRRLGLDVLPWTPEARGWQARVLSMRTWFPEQDWPDVSDATLAGSLERWLQPYLGGCNRRDQLAQLDLPSILRSLLTAEQARRLNEGAPTHVVVPSGSRVALTYRPGEAPVLAVKLQELFGATDTPRVGFGRIPVMLHLLSPARRPVQVTQDLRGFWERTYAEVRKELKGRYPKHPWPDNPMQALPSARPLRRRRS